MKSPTRMSDCPVCPEMSSILSRVRSVGSSMRGDETAAQIENESAQVVGETEQGWNASCQTFQARARKHPWMWFGGHDYPAYRVCGCGREEDSNSNGGLLD